MAQLALSVAGAAVGSLFGAPQLGWMIGSAIGGSLVSGPNITQEGSRLSDLRVQSSALGVDISHVYGSMRVTGNLIWSTPILETRHEDSQSSGGKGGGGGQTVTNVSYTYSQTFAIGICSGPILAIRKIWANGELLYNVSDAADLGTLITSNYASTGFTVYFGTETQTANASMQASVGVDNCPAYRGLAYIVFNDLQLAKYGNRTPNLEFEVVTHGTPHLPAWSPVDTLDPLTQITFGAGRFVAIRSGTTTLVTSSDGVNWVPGSMPAAYSWQAITYGGGLFMAVSTGGGYATSPDGINWTARVFPESYLWSTLSYGNGLFLVTAFYTGHSYGRCAASPDGINWTVYDFPGFGLNSTFGLGKFVVLLTNNSQVAVSTSGLVWTVYNLPTQTVSSWQSIAFGDGVFVVLSLNYAEAAASPNAITWTRHTTPAIHSWFGLAYGNGLFVAVADSAAYAMSSSDGGVTWTLATLPSSAGRAALGYGNGTFVAISQGAGTDSLAIATGLSIEGVPLSTIVEDQCAACGLTAIDVSALTDEVHGYLVPGRMTGRAAIEPLQQAFYFDAVESGNVLKFVKRGGAAVAHIPEADLAAHTDGSEMPDNLQMVWQQETELPHEVTVNYFEAESAYAVGNQYARRQIGNAKQVVAIDLKMAISATKARQIAEVLMWDAWMSRATFTGATGRKYADLEPTDVITVTKGAATHTVRIVDKNEANGILTFQLARDNAGQYAQSPAAVSQNTPDGTLLLHPPTVAKLLDIPLLRDVDNGAGFYVAACPSSNPSAWAGAILYRSIDGAATWNTYAPAMAIASVIGTASDVLGDFHSGNLFDELNAVTVNVLADGELASISEALALSGANTALLGDEIITFRNAELVSAGSYRLTGLIRGKRGTEWAMSTHVSGERFVALTTTAAIRVMEGASEIGLPRLYKMPTIGASLNDTAMVVFTDTGESLRPYSPVELGGGRDADGNLTLHWTRRARLAAEWRDNVDVALDEASEAYEVEIWDAAYSGLVRTITGLAAASASYSATDQTTDFGSPPASLGVKVFQLSAIVGRGHAATAVV